MKLNRLPFPILMPLLAVLSIAAWGGGLGVLFIWLNHTSLGEWGAVIVGLALIVVIPTMAAFVLSRMNGSGEEGQSHGVQLHEEEKRP